MNAPLTVVADPRFAKREARKQHRAALTDALEGALALTIAARELTT